MQTFGSTSQASGRALQPACAKQSGSSQPKSRCSCASCAQSYLAGTAARKDQSSFGDLVVQHVQILTETVESAQVLRDGRYLAFRQ